MGKRELWQRAFCIGLTVSLMALAVWFSSQSGGSSNGLSRKAVETVAGWLGVTLSPGQMDFWNLLARKAAHFGLYWLMGVGACGALLTTRLKGWRALAAAVLVCVLFAATDELHQWLAGAERHGSVWDVMLDTVGSGCGCTIMMVLHRLFVIK